MGYVDYENKVRANADASLRYDHRISASASETPPAGEGEGGVENGEDETEMGPRVHLDTFPILNTSSQYWCFPVHDTCWELLRDRVGYAAPPNVVARHIFAVLHNTPATGDGYLVPSPTPKDQQHGGEGDHYGGASAFQNPLRRSDVVRYYFNLVNSAQSSYLTGDPREVLQEDEDCLWEALQTVSKPHFPISTQDGRVLVGEDELREKTYYNPGLSPSLSAGLLNEAGESQGGKPQPEDVLARLPNELLTLILCQLPTRDLGSLRLASRYAADVAAPKQLAPHFWSSRFAPDAEMGFVFAGPWPCISSQGDTNNAEKKQHHWRELYLKARATLTCRDLFPGFVNRKRIWSVLRHISEAVRLRLKNDTCCRHWENNATATCPEHHTGPQLNGHGVNEKPLYRDLELQLPSGLQGGDSVAADVELDVELFHCASRNLLRHRSCRLFGLSLLTLTGENGHTKSIMTKLHVSFVYYNGYEHVCGFHASRGSSGEDRWTEVGRAGYVSPWRQKCVILDMDETIQQVDVAMSTSGIRGLRFHIKGKTGTSRSEPMGYMETDDPDVGIGSLVPQGPWVGFVVGIDVSSFLTFSCLCIL